MYFCRQSQNEPHTKKGFNFLVDQWFLCMRSNNYFG